jgi:RNA polymerase sigma factor (sigma-70 family)
MDEPLPPHRDPKQFDDLVASVSPEAILVLIDREMGPGVRAECQPEDVWQETLALAWRDRDQHRWEGLRAYRGWLIAIAKNRIRNIARDAGRAKRGGGARPVLLSGLEGAGDVSLSALLPAGSTTPSRIAGHAESARFIARALDDLPEDQRDVVRLHLLEEVAIPEVAERLGVAPHVARYRLLKGMEQFTRTLRALRSASAGPRP